MVAQHRYRMFRRMVNSIDKLPFSLASWELNLRHDDTFRKWWTRHDLKGMSVAAMSNNEYNAIIEYCKLNGAVFVSRKRKFEDFLHSSYTDKIMNLPPDLIDYTYDENEVVIVGTYQMINDALTWTKSLSPRLYSCYVQGVSLREINKCIADTNCRIIPNTSDPGGYFISTDNKDALFPLWIQG